MGTGKNIWQNKNPQKLEKNYRYISLSPRICIGQIHELKTFKKS